VIGFEEYQRRVFSRRGFRRRRGDRRGRVVPRDRELPLYFWSVTLPRQTASLQYQYCSAFKSVYIFLIKTYINFLFQKFYYFCTNQFSGEGSRKLSPTSSVGQCLARHVSQGVKEWSDIGYYDALMCPRQYSEGDETSDIGESNSRAGPRKEDHRPHTSYQLGRKPSSQGSMRVVWMTRSGIIRVKSH